MKEINEHIKLVAMRLRGIREDLEFTVEELAAKCGVTKEELESYESGLCDIPMNFICNAADVLGVEPLEIFAGQSPTMTKYWLVRKGKGPIIERQKAYKYQALAMGFKQAKALPFIVTVEPNAEDVMHLNSHEGQEFNLVQKGTLLLSIGGKELILNPGDSIIFDSTLPHGMKALNSESARLLAIIF